jgi:hypothetical protein
VKLAKLFCKICGGEELVFFVDVEPPEALSPNEVWVSVHLSDPPNLKRDDSFQLHLVPFSEHTMRVQNITHNEQPHYSGKGIPDALIPWIAEELGVSIVSSLDIPGTTEQHTAAAERMWRRLQKHGRAELLPDGRYCHAVVRATDEACRA